MAQILTTKSIYYSDVNLIAQPSNVKSRKDIQPRLDLIMVSPMAAICGPKMVKESLSLGLSVCLHRFCDVEQQVKIFRNNYNEDSKERLWAAIGLNDNNRLFSLFQVGCRNFIIDTANGYMSQVVDYTKYLGNLKINLKIIVGNVHSYDGIYLYRCMDNIGIRVGISSGSACNTKMMTSVNRGQITEIRECSEAKKKNQILFADGGISCPAYAALAFAAGADRIIMGGYFSKAEEAENIQNGEYKFWGSASYKQLELSKSKKSHSEGKILDINTSEVKPLKILVEELWGGISSAISYSGFSKIDDFIGNGTLELKYK